MKSFRLFKFLLQNSRGTVFMMVGAGVLAGLFSAGVIALVSRALSHPGTSSLVAAGFAALVIGRVVATTVGQLMLVRFSQGTILDLSLTLCARILGAPLRLLERRGGGHILTTLTDDVSSVTWAVQCLPQLAMNGAILIGCGIYLLWLSWPMFLGATLVTIFGALIYKYLYERAFKEIRAARDARSRLFGLFRGLTTGIKELMMHRGRRAALLDEEIRPAADEYRRSNLAATRQYAIADAWMQLLYYGLIGLLLFVFPVFARPSPETLTGYAFAMLYMMTPLWSIIGTVPAVARGHVALEKIEELGVSLDSGTVGQSFAPLTPRTQTLAPHIELRRAVFHYDGAADEANFTLGPLDFSLKPGELVFVVGGNGSGKSTFLKVLTGLYPLHEGALLVDGHAVKAGEEAAYREHFAVVFSDCFLFEKLLGLDRPDLESQTLSYLRLLQLDRKVGLSGREFTTLDLSQGQRKRLALVVAYLEDRPVYVFDEWAADQDPEYKQIFYTRLLPELRNRGKSVVVITHDDRYFHLGDRIVKLESGQIAHSSSALPDTRAVGAAH